MFQNKADPCRYRLRNQRVPMMFRMMSIHCYVECVIVRGAKASKTKMRWVTHREGLSLRVTGNDVTARFRTVRSQLFFPAIVVVRTLPSVSEATRNRKIERGSEVRCYTFSQQ
jgi:hypothetical protein